MDGRRDFTTGCADSISICGKISTFIYSSRDIRRWHCRQMGEVTTGKVCGGTGQGHPISICRRYVVLPFTSMYKSVSLLIDV